MFETFEWSFMTVLAPLILAAAIAYALFTRRRRSPGENAVRDAETRKQYRDETGEPTGHHAPERNEP